MTSGDQNAENISTEAITVSTLPKRKRVSITEIEKKYAASQLRILRTSQDWPLHYVRQTLDRGDMINISPTYQRRSRWDLKKKSLLIESFILNIPVPPIYLYEFEYGKYEVMDGLQRFSAIAGYMRGEFALRGLEFWKELNGKKYQQLPDIIQKGLLRRNLSAVVLLVETEKAATDEMTLDVRQALFSRLNTGGEPLNAQELRNALYPSKFNRMIHEIARSDDFCDIWKMPKGNADDSEIQRVLDNNQTYRTMSDCEIALRVFAVKEEVINKKGGSMRSILDRMMKMQVSASDHQTQENKDLFLSIQGRWVKSFGVSIFENPSSERPSKPLFDALMVALIINQDLPIEDHVEEIKELLTKALSNPVDYETLVGRGNTADSIRKRVELAEKIIGRTYTPSDFANFVSPQTNDDSDDYLDDDYEIEDADEHQP